MNFILKLFYHKPHNTAILLESFSSFYGTYSMISTHATGYVYDGDREIYFSLSTAEFM